MNFTEVEIEAVLSECTDENAERRMGIKVGQVWEMYGKLRRVCAVAGRLVRWAEGSENYVSNTSYIENVKAYGTLIRDVEAPQVTTPVAPQVDACAALRSSLPTMKAPLSGLRDCWEQLLCLKQRLRASIATRREWPTCPVSGEALTVCAVGAWPDKYNHERQREITACFTCAHCVRRLKE